MMQIYLIDWLNLALKLLHIIAGIAWIGASFYFNWLENKLDRLNNRDEIAGHLWAVHGGGFYYLEKYKKYPQTLPEPLHWFKWEAYVTWLSGISLLSVIYYFNDEQEKLAKDSQKLLEKTGKLSNSIVTEIKHIKNYYIAEEYHQNYFDRKNFLTDLI